MAAEQGSPQPTNISNYKIIPNTPETDLKTDNKIHN